MEKRILFFGSQITIGGAQRVLLDQALWFRQHGYSVSVAFYYDKDNLLEDWQKCVPFPIRVIGSYQKGKPVPNFFGLIKGFFHLCRFIRKEKPTVIECFTHDADLIGLTAAWICHVPGRFGSHHGRFHGLSKKKMSLHTKVINSSVTNKIICVSERAKNQALEEGIRADKIIVIPNGIPLIDPDPDTRKRKRSEIGLADSNFAIFNVGRLVPEKAQNLLIEAAAQVTELRPEARFFIAGEGPFHDALQTQIMKKSLQDKVKLLGARTDIPELLQAADLFVLFSETEGMPISLMEAMAAGLPVIASALEGMDELIEDHISGRLIPFGNVPKLAETILQLIDHPELRMNLGMNAKQTIRNSFTIEKSCQKYEKVFFGGDSSIN